MNICEAIFHAEGNEDLVFRVVNDSSEYFYVKNKEVWCQYAQPEGFPIKPMQFNFGWLKTVYEIIDLDQAKKELEQYQKKFS